MHRAAAAAFALALLLGQGAAAAAAAEDGLQRQQAEARRERDALRERLRELEKRIAGSESSRRDVSLQLKESETAISELDRRLEALAADTRAAQAALTDVQARITTQTGVLRERQAQLADQLRAQYAGGLSPWAALLSGEDPQDIARELGYLEYVSRARAQAVRAVREALDELANLEASARSHEQELRQLADETTRRRAELDERRKQRLAVLQRIDTELKTQRGEAERLARNEQRLGELVDALGVAIAEAEAARRRAEEARRVAEEKRRAEEARLAEEKRRLAEAQRLAQERLQAEERRLAQQRRAEQARRAAAARDAEEARRSEEAHKVAEARRAAEEIRAQQGMRIAGRVEGLAPGTADPAPQATGSQGAPRGAEAQRGAPAGAAVALASPSLNGLAKGLPYPVRGEVQGRFGMERPEGGTWRGIVLRAAEGVRVGAVAPGRVVYAGWLSGFGNLLILDHGEQYLTVYAYNQSLLKEVGDVVAAGEAIATVGATGGQVEPGLYFEIRHGGKPVNPLLWLGG